MDNAQWSQEMGSNTCNSQMVEKKVKPQEQLNCPRCNSTNTKFCYYNNYSLTQPRYFCKTCRRYWTEGGSLRNVPVGGGSRKNKKSISSSSSSISTSSSKPLDLSSQNPNKTLEAQDLNLAFHDPHDYLNLSVSQKPENNSNRDQSSPFSAMELFRTGISSRGLNSYSANQMPMTMPMGDSNTLYSSGFPFQELNKPTLNFSLDTNGGRLFFPFGTEVGDQSKGQGSSNGYWTGMLGGGSW